MLFKYLQSRYDAAEVFCIEIAVELITSHLHRAGAASNQELCLKKRAKLQGLNDANFGMLLSSSLIQVENNRKTVFHESFSEHLRKFVKKLMAKLQQVQQGQYCTTIFSALQYCGLASKKNKSNQSQNRVRTHDP